MNTQTERDLFDHAIDLVTAEVLNKPTDYSKAEHEALETLRLMSAADTVTATVKQVEAALRKYLAILDYDLHKNLECGEDSGEDTYASEAADLMDALRKAAAGPAGA